MHFVVLPSAYSYMVCILTLMYILTLSKHRKKT